MTARTFLEVFPYASLWFSFQRNYFLLVGTQQPLSLDFQRLVNLISQEDIQQELEPLGIIDAYDVLACFIMDEETLSGIIAGHLLNWAEIFHLIRRDLVELNSNGRVSTMNLQGSPQESLSESSGCDYCGGCCEIRGGPPEFTDGFEPPERWFLYFRGDGCSHQRFCPFLFEYFATGKFFCSIYRVKPKCCWTFDREECEFLQKDVARERAEAENLR